MTWEIVVGIFALIAAFIPVVTVAVRVNRTLVLLEAAVLRLDAHVDAQKELNEKYGNGISGLDRRLLLIENEVNTPHRQKGQD